MPSTLPPRYIWKIGASGRMCCITYPEKDALERVPMDGLLFWHGLRDSPLAANLRYMGNFETAQRCQDCAAVWMGVVFDVRIVKHGI